MGHERRCRIVLDYCILKWLWTCVLFLGLGYPLLAQTPNPSIEIEGLQVHPGMTVSEVLLLFKGKQVTREDRELQITVPRATHDRAGKELVLAQIRGTLHISNEIVIGACRPWDYSETEDSELARVLFTAVNENRSTPTSQRAILITSVDRKPEWTAESLTIVIGQREIDVTRQEYHLRGAATAVNVEECLWQPGYGPLVPVEATDKH
jgi:hypothetical protein